MEIGGRDCGGRRKGKDWRETERSERKVQYASLKDEKGFKNWGENSALFSPVILMQEPSPFMQ